jgi:3D (Asp-Asp-Asp) domain-containing protein
VRVPVTAYSSTPDQTDDTPFITASGTHVRWGIVAANFLPIGTRVRLPDHFGDQVFVVEDRMNARYDKHMDIWMETKTEARTWGIRRVTIEVL